jgi:hypothetical protein
LPSLTNPDKSRLLAATSSDIHRNFVTATKAVIRGAFQYPQQLHLEPWVQIASFVQKECALVGQFDQSGLHGIRTAERTLLIAKQLAFQEVFGKCGAVEINKRVAGAWRKMMDGARHELFAGSSLPINQHGRSAFCHALHQGEELAH